MQMAVVEYGRNVLGLKGAHSTEFEPDTPHPVISMMEAQRNVDQLGGTMRLGAYPCDVVKGTLAYKVYGKGRIQERHRHRYEFNNAYRAQYEKGGMVLSGIYPDGNLVEMVELSNHPFFIAGQFHPEYKSTVEKPHALFMGLVKAMLKHKGGTHEGGK
jgi:CTP synthase